MRRAIGRINYIILVCVLMCMASCSKKEEINFNENDKLLISMVYNNFTESEYQIIDITCYYYQYTFYYDVTTRFTLTDNTEDSLEEPAEVVYILFGGHLTNFFNIDYPEKCYEYFAIDYEAFLEAKEKGVKNDYSQEYIKSLITEFFSETEPPTEYMNRDTDQ